MTWRHGTRQFPLAFGILRPMQVTSLHAWLLPAIVQRHASHIGEILKSNVASWNTSIFQVCSHLMFPFDVPIWCWEFPFFGVQDGSSWSWCWWDSCFCWVLHIHETWDLTKKKHDRKRKRPSLWSAHSNPWHDWGFHAQQIEPACRIQLETWFWSSALTSIRQRMTRIKKSCDRTRHQRPMKICVSLQKDPF